MFDCLRLGMGELIRVFHSRQSLRMENFALRQQVIVFKRQHRRPRLTASERLFRVLLHRFWSSWKTALVVVSPDTVVRWAPCWLPTVLAADRTSTRADW